jgi:hypothetical protein
MSRFLCHEAHSLFLRLFHSQSILSAHSYRLDLITSALPTGAGKSSPIAPFGAATDILSAVRT